MVVKTNEIKISHAIDIKLNKVVTVEQAQINTDYLCPECKGTLHIRCKAYNSKKQAHFFHTSIFSDCSYIKKAETEEHLNVKNSIKKRLENKEIDLILSKCSWCNDFIKTKIDYSKIINVKEEYKLAKINGIADIACLDSNNDISYIFEICKSHTTESRNGYTWFEINSAEYNENNNYLDNCRKKSTDILCETCSSYYNNILETKYIKARENLLNILSTTSQKVRIISYCKQKKGQSSIICNKEYKEDIDLKEYEHTYFSKDTSCPSGSLDPLKRDTKDVRDSVTNPVAIFTCKKKDEHKLAFFLTLPTYDKKNNKEEILEQVNIYDNHVNQFDKVKSILNDENFQKEEILELIKQHKTTLNSQSISNLFEKYESNTTQEKKEELMSNILKEYRSFTDQYINDQKKQLIEVYDFDTKTIRPYSTVNCDLFINSQHKYFKAFEICLDDILEPIDWPNFYNNCFTSRCHDCMIEGKYKIKDNKKMFLKELSNNKKYWNHYKDKLEVLCNNIFYNIRLIITKKEVEELLINKAQMQTHMNYILEHIKFQQNINYFINGSGGVGKSYLLSRLIQTSINIFGKDCIYATSSTGSSAESLGQQGLIAQTIDSCFGINRLNEEFIDRLIENKENESDIFDEYLKTRCKPKKRKIKNCILLLIDEISMIDKFYFSLLNYAFKKYRQNISPFGGITILVCGDLAQLPPVVKSSTIKGWEPTGNSYYCIESQAWSDAHFNIYKLDLPMRQSNPEFATVLNELRLKSKYTRHVSLGTKSFLEKIKIDNEKFIDDNFVCIFATNKYKDLYNLLRYNELDTFEETITIDYTYDYQELLPVEESYFEKDTEDNEEIELKWKNCKTNLSYDKIKNMFNETEHEQCFKENSKIVFFKNINIKLGIVNGTTGIIKKIGVIEEKEYINKNSDYFNDIDPTIIEKEYIDIELTREHINRKNNNDHTTKYCQLIEENCIRLFKCCNPEYIYLNEDKNKRYRQLKWYFPLELAYATTIHKQQGLTIDGCNIIIKKDDFIQKSLLYVALSRSTSPDTIKLYIENGFKSTLINSIYTDDNVIKYEKQTSI